jgi:hypothetical protein
VSEVGTDAATGTGVVVVQGVGASVESGDSAASSGTVGFSGIAGNGAALEVGADVASASGVVVALANGAGSAVESGADIVTASGRVFVSGFANIFEAADYFNADGSVIISGAGSATESADTASGNASPIIDYRFVEEAFILFPLEYQHVTMPINPAYDALSIDSEFTKWQLK